MEPLFFLFFSELFLLMITYWITRGNLISPAFVSIVFFTLSTVCVIYNIDFWDVSYSFYTCFVIITGQLCMLIPEIMYCNKNGNRGGNLIPKYTIVKVNSLVNIMIIAIVALMLVLQIAMTLKEGQFRSNGLYAIGLVKNSEDGSNPIIKVSSKVIQILGTT